MFLPVSGTSRRAHGGTPRGGRWTGWSSPASGPGPGPPPHRQLVMKSPGIRRASNGHRCQSVLVSPQKRFYWYFGGAEGVKCAFVSSPEITSLCSNFVTRLFVSSETHYSSKALISFVFMGLPRHADCPSFPLRPSSPPLGGLSATFSVRQTMLAKGHREDASSAICYPLV